MIKASTLRYKLPYLLFIGVVFGVVAATGHGWGIFGLILVGLVVLVELVRTAVAQQRSPRHPS